MKLIKANLDWNQKLINFYKDNILTGRIDIRIQRQDNFFSPYDIQSDDHVTYVLVDENQDIQASATLVFKQAFFDGKEQTIGFATDLRVSPKRNAVLEWSHHFMPILRKEQHARNCEHVFSIVTEGQQQALNAFLRPRNQRRKLPRYFLYRKFDIVSLHGFLPFVNKPLSGIQVIKAQKEHLIPLSQFIVRKMKAKSLNFNFSEEVFLKNLSQWKDLGIEDFYIAFDSEAKIRGCTALWNPLLIESYTPVQYDPKTITLRESLNFLSYFRMARKLVNVEDQFQFYMLTYLLADNQDIMHSIIYTVFHSVPRDHFLTYLHFKRDLNTKPHSTYLDSRIHCGLYYIITPEAPLPNFLKPKLFDVAPDFELAFL